MANNILCIHLVKSTHVSNNMKVGYYYFSFHSAGEVLQTSESSGRKVDAISYNSLTLSCLRIGTIQNNFLNILNIYLYFYYIKLGKYIASFSIIY